jgi:CRISPR/Cas system-associated exonuclease Cas4 (RecB family)
VAELTYIKDLDDPASRALIRYASVADKIEAFLEDLNVDTFKIPVEFQLSSSDSRRNNLFHASMVGSISGRSLDNKYPMGCSRQLYYSVTGAKGESSWPTRVRRILDTGTAIHALLQAYLTECAHRTQGDQFLDEVDINPAENETAGKYDLSGHMDGLYICKPNDVDSIRFGLEIKTINEQGYKETSGPHPEHLIQGTIYQKCLDLPVMVYLYYNKNDSSIAEFAIPFDPLRWDAIAAKLDFVRIAALENKMPEQEVSWACRTCQYKVICKPPQRDRGSWTNQRLGARKE